MSLLMDSRQFSGMSLCLYLGGLGVFASFVSVLYALLYATMWWSDSRAVGKILESTLSEWKEEKKILNCSKWKDKLRIAMFMWVVKKCIYCSL